MNKEIFDEAMHALTRGRVAAARREREQNVLTIRTDATATQQDIDALIQHHARRTKKAAA